MTTIKRFLCWIGWHSHSLLGSDFAYTGFDGCSLRAKCKWCGFVGMIDSQGNLF